MIIAHTKSNNYVAVMVWKTELEKESSLSPFYSEVIYHFD